MKFLLDTDTISFYLRDVPTVVEQIKKCKPSDLVISGITLAELRFGAHRKKSRGLHRGIDLVLSDINVLPFDEEAAEVFAKLNADLFDVGLPIGQFDAMNAAIAMAHKLILVTGNEKHYKRVPGLKVENWNA